MGKKHGLEIAILRNVDGSLRTEAYSHNSGGIEFPCRLCGEGHEQNHSAIRLLNAGKDCGDVCPDCAAAGPMGAAERMREHARGLRAWADELDSDAVEVGQITDWATVEDLEAVYREFHKQLRDDSGADPDELPF